MSLKKKILGFVPVVAGLAAAVGVIESGAASEIADLVMANQEYLQPLVEASITIAAFFGTYYVAEKQCDYFVAEAKYIP